MEYLIVSGESLEALVTIVNEYLAKGWQVQGNPFVVDVGMWLAKTKRRGQLVAQALVKENGGHQHS